MITTALLNGIYLNALVEAGNASRANRETTKFTLSLNGTWDGGSKMTASTGAAFMGGQRDEARAGRFTLVSDEPVPLGTDTGASLLEYELQALASCYTVTIAMAAARRGIELESVQLELSAMPLLCGLRTGVVSGCKPICRANWRVCSAM
ncbi:OsmC-like protein [Pseudomonas frederiksbergensis]|uniref:OsmC-like protein n=3 Tax=Pseudomonas TaxID=286 RepID=A0A1P8F4B2_9PSED|nr:hypothetical protein PFAS1_28725 [Pseudomonas frederiksbergensis]SEB31423.1 OsmC-like protein [Pseudomonas frederiksbergensis]HBN9861371.1 OsmC family protein [Pseudomonas aeruginosa]HBN9886523.1 OsmC family protein [Pseudomonas aeruginosa]